MEKWDLYDENRQMLSKTIEKGQKHDAYTLRVHFCLFNSFGKMLIQQRASSKKHWPNVWDLTLSGSSQVGETSKEAIAREVKEEFGLDIDFSTERACFTFNYANCFDDFYIIERFLYNFLQFSNAIISKRFAIFHVTSRMLAFA